MPDPHWGIRHDGLTHRIALTWARIPQGHREATGWEAPRKRTPPEDGGLSTPSGEPEHCQVSSQERTGQLTLRYLESSSTFCSSCVSSSL